MERHFPLAVLCGVLIGFGMYWFLAPDWFLAAGTGAVYAGAAYFYFAFDVSLLGRMVRFEHPMDRLGYGVGLLGLSVSPLAYAHYYRQQDMTTLPFVVLFLGAIAFLFIVSKAHQQNDHV